MFRFFLLKQQTQGGIALFAMGYSGTGALSTTEKYSFVSNTRTAGASISPGYWNFGVTGNRQHAIIAGGFNGTSNFNTTRKYAYVDDAVSTSTNLVGAARRGLAGFSSSADAYFAGGFTSTGTSLVDSFRYSDSTTTSKASLNHERYAAGAFASTTTGYISGGRVTSAGGFDNTTSRSDKYSFSGNNWTNGTALALAVQMQSQCASSTHGYIISGTNNESTLTTAITKYEMSTDSTSAGTSLTVARADSNASSNIVKAIITGGSTAYGSFIPTTSCEIYAFSNNSVTNGTALSSARMIHGFGSASSTPAHL